MPAPRTAFPNGDGVNESLSMAGAALADAFWKLGEEARGP